MLKQCAQLELVADRDDLPSTLHSCYSLVPAVPSGKLQAGLGLHCDMHRSDDWGLFYYIVHSRSQSLHGLSCLACVLAHVATCLAAGELDHCQAASVHLHVDTCLSSLCSLSPLLLQFVKDRLEVPHGNDPPVACQHSYKESPQSLYRTALRWIT